MDGVGFEGDNGGVTMEGVSGDVLAGKLVGVCLEGGAYCTRPVTRECGRFQF